MRIARLLPLLVFLLTLSLASSLRSQQVGTQEPTIAPSRVAGQDAEPEKIL